MAEPYVGEIRMFAGNFAPAGWATCDGQIVPIAQYETLFNLIGTTYGGDGQTTFALPNLTARVPIHTGSNGTSNYALAQNGGVTTVTLTTAQLPVHTHAIVADANAANTPDPTNATYATATPKTPYNVPNAATNPRPAPTFRNMSPTMLAPTGGSQPHDNMQPYLALTYIISFFGVFPSPT